MKIGKRMMIGLVLSAAVLICGATTATAAQSEATNANQGDTQMPPEVKAILNDVAEYYSGLDSMNLEASLKLQVTGPGIEQTMEQEMTLTARKPNKLVLNIERGMLGGKAIADGETLYTHFPDQNAYLKEDAPADFANLAGTPTLVMLYSRSAGPPVLLRLLHPDPYNSLTRDVNSTTYQGAEEVDGKECHHLKMTEQRFDWELWVRKGDTPTVEKVRTDLTRAFQQASQKGQSLEDLEAHSVVKVTSWEANPQLADDTFQFTPPENATEYSSMIDMIRSSRDQSNGGETSQLGEEAPDFTAPLLDGDEVTLSDHEGSDVVVLDFWATWCPPCKKAMPELQAVAEEYSDKPVAIYAVNQQEDSETVRQFMDERDLSLTVLLDKQGDIASDYGVRGIPHTVVIGKAGTIQATHTGFNPNMQNMLSSEIEKLLAGESLVETSDE